MRPFVTQSKIKLEFMYICIRDNSFAPVATILPLDMADVLMVLYIAILPLDKAAVLMVWYISCFTIRYESCTDGVVYYDATIRYDSCTDGVAYLFVYLYIWQLY